MDTPQREDDALFRYQLIAPLLDPDLQRGDQAQQLKEIAGQEHPHPVRGRVRRSVASLNPRSFYRGLLEQLGLKPAFQRSDCKRQLDSALMELWETQRRQTVVVIDEAHLLSPAMLEEVRFLTNHQMDSTSPLALLLVGQPELGRKLILQAFEAVRQRITLRYHLGGLSLPDTREYIVHHLKVAGAALPLFGEEAIRLIYQRTRGIPREVNDVCSSCLLAAFAEQKPVVDEATVKTVLAEFPEN